MSFQASEQRLPSTAPASYAALLGLAEEAAKAQAPPVQVFPFEVGQYEPGSYLTVEKIEHDGWTWAAIGTFAQYEDYDICGRVTVFTGDTVTSPGVAVQVMKATYALYEACVMTPVMSNRDMPILGGSQQVFLVLPSRATYKAAPGIIGGQPAGWEGTIVWAFHFRAYVTPGTE